MWDKMINFLGRVWYMMFIFFICLLLIGIVYDVPKLIVDFLHEPLLVKSLFLFLIVWCVIDCRRNRK